MMIPHRHRQGLKISINLLIGLLLLANAAYGKHKKDKNLEPPFQYEAGTEDMAKGCAGRLEVLAEGFKFSCPGGAFELPFSGIVMMQYRPDVSSKVLDMSIPWKLKPQLSRVRENKYFTIVGNDHGTVRAVVLRVDEKEMRPYFAEIELRSGKSVQEYRSFDEFN